MQVSDGLIILGIIITAHFDRRYHCQPTMEFIPIAPSGADADDEQAEKADDEKWPREDGWMHYGKVNDIQWTR